MTSREYQLTPIPVRRGNVQMFYLRDRDDERILRGSVKRWNQLIKKQDILKKDAISFARQAMQRWSYEHSEGRTAGTIRTIKDLQKYRPNMEIGILAAAQADWLKRNRIVGLCHFRCTWSQNITIDYVVVDPFLDSDHEGPIDGLGIGIFHHLCSVAVELGAKAIWGETTPNSVGFYRKMLDKIVDHPIDDLIVLGQEQYLKVKSQISDLWEKHPKANRV